MEKRSANRKNLVPAEGNFEEHPYFRVGDRNAGSGILSYRDEVRTKDGNVFKREWTVLASHGRGLPGRFDQDVYVALLQLIDRKGLPERGDWLTFSLYELVDLMSRGHSGRDYQQVRDSLQRMAATTIESKNAFYHRGKKEYVNGTFSLLLEVKLSEYEDEGGARSDRNRILLSDFFVESYRANYLKHIDSRFYWSLSSPIAKRLYRLIDKKRNGQHSWETELFSLKDKIPLSDYKYASKIKEKLSPAHSELVSKGFLESVDYRKTAGTERACYRIDEGFAARRASTPSIPQPTDEEFIAIQRLKAEGMQSEIAEELVSSYGPSRVMHYAQSLTQQKRLRNPAGWLRKAIESGYELDMPPSNQPQEPTPNNMHNTPEWELSPTLPDLDVHQGNGEPDVSPVSSSVVGDSLVLDPEAEEIWSRTLDSVSELTGTPSASLWFEGFVPVSVDGGLLSVVCPSEYAKLYIEGKFGHTLDESLSLVSDGLLSLDLITVS